MARASDRFRPLARVCFHLALLGGSIASGLLRAEELPIRRYDVGDGLAHSRVNCLHQDRMGYLWIGTWEGLSRFDGYRFTNYDTADGLRSPLVTSIAEDAAGRLWVSTLGGGISRLLDDPSERPRRSGESASEPGENLSALRGAAPAGASPLSRAPLFESYSIGDVHDADFVDSILFDDEGSIWGATNAGLYRARPAAGRGIETQVRFEPIVPGGPVGGYHNQLRDREGRLWFGSDDGLIEIVHGRVHRLPLPSDHFRGGLAGFVAARGGGLLVAFEHALYECTPPDAEDGTASWRRLPVVFDPAQEIYDLLQEPGGALWIGTAKGLIRLEKGNRSLYTTAQGLSDDFIRSLARDEDGNLWIGTNGGGLCRLSRQPIVSFTRASGLQDRLVVRVVEDRSGRIYASTARSGVAEIVGGRAVPIVASRRQPFDRIGCRILQDRRGVWWIGTDEGLYTIEGPELRFEVARKLGPAEGVVARAVYDGQGVMEGPAGEIWVGAVGPALLRLEPARRAGPRFDAISLARSDLPMGVSRMGIDRTGALWLGHYGTIERRIGSAIRPVRAGVGLPETEPRAFFCDSRGWMWIGLRNRGVSVTRDPAAEAPAFTNYSTREGLASDAVWSVTEDLYGRIYLGTGRGLDQLDPMSGRIRHFTSADGLAGDLVNQCMRDSRGDIWVSTAGGVSRLRPQAESAAGRLPDIYMTRIQTAGEEILLPERGATNVGPVILAASRNNLLIEFVGVTFESERAVSYQHRLEGADPGWSAPSGARSVDYANLAPGSYRFLARAIGRDGAPSPRPVSFSFTILPPFWRRGWFVALIAVGLAGAAYAVHSARLSRVLELEKIRRQIATDIHDDMGSGLSQVAILSEVGRREKGPALDGILGEIAELARTMRESMSDIVWAVDPRMDRLADLVQRMRQVTFNLLESEGVRVEFVASDAREIESVPLPPDRRRHLLLMFKEALTNVARHAKASSVSIRILLEPAGRLVLTIEDDGRGFDPADRSKGHGLESLRQRARELGGALEIASAPGKGTRVRLEVRTS